MIIGDYVTMVYIKEMSFMCEKTCEEEKVLVDIYEMIRVAKEEVENGETVNAKETLEELREKHGI